VAEALIASEAEQLAALQSIDVFPAERVSAELIAAIRDEDRPTSVRIACIGMAADRQIVDALKYLRPLAMSLGKEPSEIKAAAMMALPSLGAMYSLGDRERARQRFESEEPQVALAARAALLAFSLRYLGQ
jgi:hypothetical protein